MENQQQPQPPAVAARPWFRLASLRTEIPVAAAAPPPPVSAAVTAPPPAAPAVPPPVAAPRPPQPAPTAPERPLFRLGSLLRATATVPPPPQEPIQAPAQLQTRAPTPPPTAPTTPPPPPPSPRTPLATATTQDQQLPSQAQRSPVTPSPAVRAPSPPAPSSPPSPRVIMLTEPIPTPSTAVRQQQQQTSPPSPPPPQTTTTSVSPPPPPPQTTTTPVSPPPPPPVTTLTRSPAPSPRLPSPPLHPEPETKPVVTVVTAQPSLMKEPSSSPYKDKNNNNNGNGGEKRLGMTHLGGQPRGGVSPPLPSPTSTPKKPEPAVAAAAVPGKKKSGVSDEAESRMRVLTLAGENMGAYMNLGSGVHHGGAMKGQGRHLTQTPTAHIDEKVAFAVAPGSNGGDAPTKDVESSTAASKWKAGPSATKPMAALVNSNVQSVNNSIMFNSSCAQRSPGVHITLSSGSRRPSSYSLLGEYSDENGGRAATTTGLGDDRTRANQFTSQGPPVTNT